MAKRNKTSRGSSRCGDAVTRSKRGRDEGRGSQVKKGENDGAVERHSYNDMSWYDHNPNLTIAASQIPFPYRPGMSVQVTDQPSLFPSVKIPGVMAIHWKPWIGGNVNTDEDDPINITANQIFNKVRAAYSGSLDADSPDFAIYLLAMDSLYSYISMLKRVFRTITTYSTENHVVPDSILYALGCDQAAIIALKQGKMQLFQNINVLINSLAQFHTPKVFDLFNRHYWMNDHVFADANMLNSQCYVFVQDAYLQYGESSGAEAAGMLTYVNAPSMQGSDIVQNLFTYGMNLINALAATDDTFIISGYLMRAFNEWSTFYVDEIQYNEALQLEYEPLVLSQIENTHTPFTYAGTHAYSIDLTTITQDPTTNTVKANYTITNNVSGTPWNALPFINIHSVVPTVQDVVEATRLQTVLDGQTNKVYAGTELVTGVAILGYDGKTMENYDVEAEYNDTTATRDNLQGTLSKISRGKQFDWAPFTFIFTQNGTESPTYSVYVAGDIQNFTVLSYDQMKEINKICLYSEFNSFGF